MPRDSAGCTDSRKNEIVSACAKLYDTMGFKEITIKEIARFTSFTRTSIYNYFQTKEEIFLALLQQEYEQWCADLEALLGGRPLSKSDFARELAHTLERRLRMLKLLSMNLYDIEQNSSVETLVEFKKAYGRSMQLVGKCLERFCPELDQDGRREFLYAFFPFVYGIYPYAVVTDKQLQAMQMAQVEYQSMSVFDIALTGTKKLLGCD